MADDIDDDPFHRMSAETLETCWWCGMPAWGTARDSDDIVHLTCGQKGHGRA